MTPQQIAVLLDQLRTAGVDEGTVHRVRLAAEPDYGFSAREQSVVSAGLNLRASGRRFDTDWDLSLRGAYLATGSWVVWVNLALGILAIEGDRLAGRVAGDR